MEKISTELRRRRRHLPHWQQGGQTYFITFRSARENLPPQALRQVIHHILYDHGKKYELFFAVVMPNHVHTLIETRDGHRLDRIVHAWKSFTAKQANHYLK